MKGKIRESFAALLVVLTLAGCGEWTDAEALDYETHGIAGTPHNEAYYANLREYKRNKRHPVAFGWYSDWSGVGTQMTSQLMGLPDSMDFVSMWGNWHGLTPEKKEDLRRVQQIKGTKVLMCFIIDDIGAQTTPPEIEETLTVDGTKYATVGEARAAFWGWYHNTSTGEIFGDNTPEGMDRAIRKYAGSLLDTIRKYGWDGFDFDLEPGFGHGGNIASYPDRIHIVLDELSKELGPLSGTDKLLCVDGEPYLLQGEDALKCDWFLIQAYEDTDDSQIDGRMQRLFSAFSGYLTQEEVLSKTVLCSNFESYGSIGGPSYTTRDGEQTNQLTGYAKYYHPDVNGRIGGVGAFRMGFDTNYRYMRAAIGVLNPVAK